MEKGKRERMTDRLCYISFCQMFHDKDEVEAPVNIESVWSPSHLPLCTVNAQI